MADFCRQCTVAVLGMDGDKNDHVYPDLPPPDKGKGYAVLCEGCGATLVDNEGTCLVDNCEGGKVHDDAG